MLTSNRYGKDRVRVLRLDRSRERHEVRELTVKAMLAGDFARSYTDADNSSVVATDTVKNIVNALAHDHPAAETEEFLGIVAAFFLERYGQVEEADVTGTETRWTRLALDGAEHDHAFTLDGNGRHFARVVATRSGTTTQSGVEGFTFMKTTSCGWAGFHTDEYRTLPDTHDRIVGTSMDATWTWSAAPESYPRANARIMDAMMRDFVATYSHSVQDSQYRMGEAALAAVPDIAEIRFAMPNKHYIPVDVARLGREGGGRAFLPTDEPHGQIECVVSRG